MGIFRDPETEARVLALALSVSTQGGRLVTGKTKLSTTKISTLGMQLNQHSSAFIINFQEWLHISEFLL